MRRIVGRDRLRYNRLATRRGRYRISRRVLVRRRRLGLGPSSHEAELAGVVQPSVISSGEDLRIEAPADFSLSRNYDEVMGFLWALRRAAFREEGFRKRRGRNATRRVIADFKTIKRLAPAAGLLLAAELDRWQRKTGTRLAPVDLEQWDPTVRFQLFELGLFALLNTKGLCDVPLPNDVDGHRTIRFTTGTGSSGMAALEFKEALERIAGPIDAETFLYDGITEAMTNTVHHAYPKSARYLVPPSMNRWWMSGSYDAKNRRMKVMLLDQGVGIPATLPRSQHWERVRAKIDSIIGRARLLEALAGHWNVDAYMIQAAMETSRTSTGLAGRGHGLDTIREFIDNSDQGRLRVLSGRGEVIYVKGSGIERVHRRASIGGTLVEWEVWR